MDFELDFSTEEKKPTTVKTWYNVNDIEESDIPRYKRGYNPLNPFRMEDKVILNLSKQTRYKLIEGITPDMVGRVSEILGNNMINVSYWDTRPSMIKNIHISEISLSKDNSFKTLFRVFFYAVIRKVINPNKLPAHIEAEIAEYWGR